MGMDYADHLMELRGIVVEIHDGSVAIDFKGRIGHLRIPLRMLITDYPLQLGQEVGFRMSLVEVLFKEPNPKYVEILKNKESSKESLKENN